MWTKAFYVWNKAIYACAMAVSVWTNAWAAKLLMPGLRLLITGLCIIG